MESSMLQPNATLYVKNIDWKIKKPLLKRALYSLFTRHGKVLEIIVLRRDGLRGQAWIIMDDVQASTAALQAENGFTFFGKDLVIEYAKETSDRIAKKNGTYVPRAKRRKVEKKQAAEDDGAAAGGDAAVPDGSAPTGDSAQPQSAADAASAVPPPPPPPPLPDNMPPSAPPSKYLLAQDLPPECNEMVLAMLFRQYTGYKEVRMPRPGLAFIEFDDEPHATLALKALQGFSLSQKDKLSLTYGKA